MENRYRPAELFQLRVPALPVSAYASPSHSLSEGASDPSFRLAVGLASADLARQLEAHRAGKLAATRERRLRGSIFRYRTRASTRPTPFGMFAGVAFGDIDDKTAIPLGAPA